MVRLLHLRHARRRFSPASSSPASRRPSAFIFTLLAFAAGFAVRPFGALVFGRLGDLVGRKYTFLVTMTLMGIGTFLIGVLPTYATIGIAAPILLIVLRLVQGLALGGEYGGAATYVAEHAPHGKRGLYTSWIQTTATLGLFMALLVILGIRTAMGEDRVQRLGLAHSVPALGRPARRLDLDPAAARRVARVPEDEGRRHAVEGAAQGSVRQLGERQDRDPRAARRDRRRSGRVVRRTVLRAVLPDPDHQGACRSTAQIMIVIALAIATPGFIFFGWLSDKIGRKPIMMAGFLLAVVTYFPIFQGITHFANPALEKALAESPVTVVADPAQCSFQLKLTGTEQYTKPCDVAKSALVARSVNYNNETAAAGAPVVVKVGDESSPPARRTS